MPSRGSRGPLRSGGRTSSVLKAVTNLVLVGLIVYLTYFFTVYFSTRPPAPVPVAENVKAANKKIEELRSQESKLLTTYGEVNPATKSVRIPIDRAMELVAAENAQPAPIPAVAATPKPGTPAPPVVAAAPAPAPAPAPAQGGMAPEPFYKAICMACHDVDGSGKAVRVAMPLIPNFTDPKWQAAHTDADLQHAMLDGKGPLMLPMKDELELDHIDPKAMVAFVRAFNSAAPKTAKSAAPTPATPPTVAATPAAVPVPGPSAQPVAAAVPSPSPAEAAPPSQPAIAPTPSNAVSPVMAAKLRAAAALYQTDCMACHGPDGRGTTVRAAMPPIPDFTARAWQVSRETSQLQVSILEGKGGLMPPWHGKLTPEQAHNLVAYVRHFGPADLISAARRTSDFSTSFQKLNQQWDDLHKQILSLPPP